MDEPVRIIVNLHPVTLEECIKPRLSTINALRAAARAYRPV